MLSRLNLGGFGVVTGIFTIYLLLCGLGLRAKFVIYYVTVMLTLLILYLVFLGKLMFRILIGLIVTLSTACVLADGNPQRGKELSAVCAACHGQDGNSPAGAFPSLAGQGQRYLVKQLNEIKSGQRAAVLMTGILDTYSAQDMLDVASFYSAQTPKGGGVDPELLVLGETIYRAGIARKSVAACTACQGLRSSEAAADMCFCNAGYSDVGGTCAACEAGKFSNAETSSCTACPELSTSTEGSSTCVCVDNLAKSASGKCIQVSICFLKSCN